MSDDQIKSIIDRVQRLQEEKRTIEDDIKEVYAEARGNGFDVKVLRAVVKHLGKDQNEIAEFDAIFDLYLQAYEQGAAVASRAHVARDAGAHTREAAKNSEIVAPDSLPAAQSEAAASESLEQGPDARVGGGDARHSPTQSDQFVAPAGEGEGIAVSADPSPVADASISRPAFILPPAKPLRPNCQHPEHCRGYGSKHCGSCERAAKAPRVGDDEDIDVPAFLSRTSTIGSTIGEQQ